MSRSKRQPYNYICKFDHKNQTWAKTQHNRVLRKIKKDLLQKLETAYNIEEDTKISLYTGSLKREGNDLWGFPCDGSHYYCGHWKYYTDEDFLQWYAESLRK